MKVLIVEDDLKVSRFISKQINEWGHQVTAVTTVGEATDVANRNMFDLVFLNLHLPDADGCELIPRLKRAWPQARIVAMTDNNSRELALETRKHGVIYYMLKPIDKKSMKDIVKYVSERLNK